MSTPNDTRRRHKHHPTIPASDPFAPEPDALSSETLRQAEDEIGMNDWLDPETGEPAEGQSPPRLEEE